MLRRMRRTVPVAVIALLVAGLFLSRRISGPEPAPTVNWDAFMIPAEAAERYIGYEAVVCGTVAASTFASGVGGEPTFLNFGRPHPEQDFDAVIWGRYRDRFDSAPDRLYDGAAVCVAGEVVEHEGVPRIEVERPAQIRIMRAG